MGKAELDARIAAGIPEETGRRNFLPLYADKSSMDQILTFLAEPFRGKIDYVVSPEPLGFILGSMMARELGAGFIALRKGRNHFEEGVEILSSSYIDHRNQAQSLVMMKDMLKPGSRVLIVDDYIETAATIQTCMTIMEDAGAEIAGIASLGACYRKVTSEMIDSGLVHCILLRSEKP